MPALMTVHKINSQSPENEILINRDHILQAVRIRSSKPEHTKITFLDKSELHVLEDLGALTSGLSTHH
jgi:hypothetical protein